MGILGFQRKEKVKAIRNMFKKEAPSLSIRMGKGTARSWIDISGTADEYGSFTSKEANAFKKYGLRPTSVLSPDEQKYLLTRRK